MPILTRELIKGLAGAAGFLLFAFALDLPLLLAAGIAAAIYIGLNFLLPKPTVPENASIAPGLNQQERDTYLAACRKSAAELTQLAASVRKHDFGATVKALAKTATDLTSYLEKNPDAIVLAYSVPRNLEHLAGMLRQYVALSQYQQPGDTAEQALQKVEGVFESAGDSLAGMYQQLLDNDIAALEMSAQTLAILMDVDTQIQNQRVKPTKQAEPPSRQTPPRLPEKER